MVTIVWNFIKNHRRIAIEVAVVLAALLVGRCTAPRPAVTATNTQETLRLQAQVKTLTEAVATWKSSFDLKVAEAVQQKSVEAKHNRVVITTRPDGTRTEERTSSSTKTDEAKTQRTTAEQGAGDGTATTKTSTDARTDASVDRRQTTTTAASPLVPRLMLGISVGASLPALMGGTPDRQLLPFAPHALLGTLSLDVRLFGPMWGGVWVSTTGATGLTIRWAFK